MPSLLQVVVEVRTSPGFKESLNIRYQKQPLLHFKHIPQWTENIHQHVPDEWIYYLVQACLHICAYGITCIFEASGYNCKAVLKRVILSLYAMREPNLLRQEGKSGLQIKPIFFQLAWNSVLTKQLIPSTKCNQFPHRLFIPLGIPLWIQLCFWWLKEL